MTTTRANIEYVLVKRTGALLTAAGMAITYAGANADLNDPIGAAIRALGGTVDDISAVTDADVLTISSDYTIDALLDVAELRTLESVQGNYALVDIGAGPENEKLSQVSNTLQASIDRLTAKVKQKYGIGVQAVSMGKIRLNFAAHGNDPEITV